MPEGGAQANKSLWLKGRRRYDATMPRAAFTQAEWDAVEHKPLPWWAWMMMSPLLLVGLILLFLVLLADLYRWLKPAPARPLERISEAMEGDQSADWD